MQGYIYVENENSSRLRFQPRYFILFPFCGLRWFLEEPKEKNIPKLLLSAQEGGWVFGGNVRVNYVTIEDPITNNFTIDKAIYPFVLELICGERFHKLRLGCEDIEIRQQWIEELIKSLHIQHYLYSCVECGAIPSKSIFCAVLADQPSIILENLPLTIPTLGSLVMMCKLNGNHGTILLAVHLENAQMSDHHIPLISSLLSFTPSLQSLSLANNYLTDDGLSQLSPSLLSCPALILLDFSSNFFSDRSVLALEPALLSLTHLSHLDLSRNRLTQDCCKSLALAIGGYSSQLTSLNLSYNVMGDQVAGLAVLLLTRDGTLIENIDLSFCGITSRGLSDLAHAIIGCATLHNISVKGNFTDEKSLILLMDAMTAHQTRFGLSPPLAQVNLLTSDRSRVYQKKSALSIHFGGLMIEDPQYPLTIEHKPMRMAIAYSSQYSTLSKSVLHRRVLPIQSSVVVKSPSTTKKAIDTQHQLPSGPIVCLRVQLMQHMESIFEMVEELSRVIGADSRQLHILSTSEMDETDCCFVILMPMEATEFCQTVFRCQSPYLSTRPQTSLGTKKGILERLPSTIVNEPAPTLPSVDMILQNLLELSKISSPILRKLGIRTIFMQRRGKNGELISPFHCHIRGGGYGGQGILTEFIPPLFPMASVMENMIDSKDDDIEELPQEQMNEFNDSQDPNSTRDRTESAIWYDEDDEEGDWKEGGLEEKNSQEDLIGSFDLPPTSTFEEVTENIDSKLTQSIRALQRAGKISNEASAFWQQAFGAEQDGEQLIEILDNALDEDGIFHYVSIRKQLSDAMLRRDVVSMESLINQIKARNIPGGLALSLAEQLLSEVLGLIRDGNNLDAMAEGPEQIGIVEDFLMACARIGYSGRETMVAVELREYLARWALQDNPEYANELPGIKQRALISNVMISRDLTLLRTTLDSPQSSTLLSKTQRQSALKLLEDAAIVSTKLTNAIESGGLEDVENAIAEAAYLNFVDDRVSQAVELLVELCSDPKPLLLPILDSLRSGNKDELDTALQEAHRVGWDHDYVHKISHMIFDERSKIVQEEIVKQKLFAMSNQIKAGETIKAIEIMQILRTLKLLKLDQTPAIQPHVQLLEKHMRRVEGLASLEEEILRLIDEHDLQKLTEVLSGRGTGRLVMSAPSADVMREWMETLELVCNLGIDQNGVQRQVTKSGTLEKAARGKEGILRNWRQRFFVLEGLSISYFTKQGGEKKGCVRVGGGAVRILSPEETGGRNFSFELQEGRDLSNIDPDLLFEARKQVKLMQKDNLEEALAEAVNAQSEQQCASILEKASKLEISLDSDLMTQAKAILVRMQHRSLKLELRDACQLIPRGQLQELVRTAKRIRLDPSFLYFKIAQLLLEKPESELSILRARGCLNVLDDSAFMRSLASIQRFDVKRLGIKEKTVLVAVLLQYSGMALSRSLMLDGEVASNAAKVIEQTLEGCMQYFVETEPMQLARNVIQETLKNGDHSHKSPTRETKLLRRAQSHFDTTTLSSESRSATQYILEKFQNIRPVDANSRKSFLGRRKSTNFDSNNSLSYSIEPIQKSILNLSKNEDEVGCELFRALLIVMGDKPLQFLNARSMKNVTDEYSLGIELVKVGINSLALRDEIYIQLLKQLNKNTKLTSRLRGWSLLVVYLHCFSPSSGFLPYVRTFISQANQQDQPNSNSGAATPNQRRARQTIMTKGSDVDTEATPSDAVCQIISYTEKILHWTEAESLIPNGFHSDVSMIDTTLMSDILKRTPMQIEIAVMTGSVYNFTICFGDIDSLFSLTYLLIQKMVGPMFNNALHLKSGMDSELIADSKNQKIDLTQKILRGFWLYEYDFLDASYDAQSMPVQPDESSVIQWQYDFIWDLLQNSSNRSRRLALRRRLLLSSEDLVNQLDLFKDMSAERDVIGTKRLWAKWLQEKTNDLPVDHCRIDLLFAEESRYVNSQLYAISSEALIYLAALQLTLSLGNLQEKWGSGHSTMMKNIDSSVRPSLKLKSYSSSGSPKKVSLPHRGSISSVLESPIDRRASLERRGSGLGNLLKGTRGRNSISSEITDIEEMKNEEDKLDIHWFGEIIVQDEMSQNEMEILEETLSTLGISLPTEMIPDIISKIAEFQTMAKHLNISLTSQRFRYMMKSAYVSYVMTWPLAGGHFFEGYLDRDEKLEKVLICISGHGLHLLTIDDWLLIFQAPIFDIQSCSVESAIGYQSMSTESKLVKIIVNEKILPIVTTSANDIQSLIQAFSLELLSRGSFPHGLEGGNDVLDLGESYQLSSDSKAVMQRFLRNFPMLPTPPPTCSLERAPSYFDPPKSRRAILAEERAEEERIELEQARLAAESQAAKTMAHLEHGKQTLQKFMTEEDEDEDDNENGASDSKKPKKNRRRTGLATMKESSENIRQTMITSAVCGVSARPALVTLTFPAPPVRGVGMRLDSMFGETSTKPPLISVSPSPRFLTVPTVQPSAFKPKFTTPKNVIFPLSVEWPKTVRNKTGPEDWDGFEEDASINTDDIPFHQTDFYGSYYLQHPESSVATEFTRSRNASLCLYSQGNSVEGDSRDFSPLLTDNDEGDSEGNEEEEQY